MIKMAAVRCLSGGFQYYDVQNIEVFKGNQVLVETDRGLQVGTVVTEIREYSEKDVPDQIPKVIRIMNREDKRRHRKNQEESREALLKAKKFGQELNLGMRFVDCFFTFDRNQLVFTFVADNRVDFRELVKKLAQVYHTRIELRQVGVRDKAKEIGGLGPCGRFLCCSTFLTDFDSVSINMAKNQYIALNPSKINGVCGRLLCCLKYEDKQYTEMKKGVPKIGQMVEISGVKGKVSSVNLLTNKIMLEQANKTFIEVPLEFKHGSSK